jgi:hypothetical protein
MMSDARAVHTLWRAGWRLGPLRRKSMHYHRPTGAVPRHPNVSIGALHGFVMRALMTFPDLLVCVSLGVEQLAGPRLALDGAAVDGVRRDGSGAVCLFLVQP